VQFNSTTKEGKKQMRNNIAFKAAIAAGLLASAGFTCAATNTANLNVTANVSSNCTVGTTPVAFGTYDPLTANAGAPLLGTGTVTITCTKGTSANIGLGLGGNAAGTTRQMGDGGTNRLPYDLFRPATTAVGAACAYTAVWGDTVGTDTLLAGAAPSKAARTYNVCGRIAAGEDPVPGNYTDVVVATVTF
jgi:spore coat protein U-like protein